MQREPDGDRIFGVDFTLMCAAERAPISTVWIAAGFVAFLGVLLYLRQLFLERAVRAT
ncbi:MAG: hypothetical protein HY675_23610 [Chloroflexi bacterium]|nr:hypothetical protein [Chloroflexota bacterium]